MNWADYFYYDESSPSCLRWAVDIRTGNVGQIAIVRKGDAAGCLKKNGSYDVRLNNKYYKVHRVIMELEGVRSIPRHMCIDHIDGNPGNNRVSNLRVTTQTVNNRNRRKSKNNTSGTCGVSWQIDSSRVTCAVACWRDLNSCTVRRVFSTKKYGLLPAYSLAVKTRSEAIEAMKQAGGGHTERHGV